MQHICLEPAAKKVAVQNSKPPLIFELSPQEGRALLEQAQDSPVLKYPATIQCFQMNTGKWGIVDTYCVIPETLGPFPSVIYYIHGAGWVFGSFHTHEKLVRELAARTHSILIFPEYTRSPEAKYPTAISQCYSILCSLPKIVDACGINADFSTLTVAGDSVGGNMATVMTIISKYQNGPCIQKQLLYYPVTNACFDTRSYCQFACNYYLYREGMMWFWDQYTACDKDRNEITASPLRATTAQLSHLPPALIINGEADVLRDEGIAYGNKLRCAGVDVSAACLPGMIHDFVMLNSLDQTNGCRLAMDLSTSWICRHNTTPS